MNEKWAYAQAMVDSGETNAVIMASVKQKFGTGISTSKLAEWRATTVDRLAARQRKERMRDHSEKWAWIREQVADESLTLYAIQKACQEKFGSGCDYYKLRRLREEVEAEAEEARKMENAIVPVEIPDEVREDSTELVPTVPPPNGSLTDIKAVQSWMKKINAKSLTLTEGGDLTMLVEHNFNIGEAE